jgi:hypothetical protein
MRGCVTDWRQKANEHTSKHECIRRPASLALHIVWGRVLPGTGFLNPGLEMGFRNDTAQQNPLRPVGTTAPQMPLGSWRHCSTEPYAPNGLSLHRKDPWVTGGTVPQSLMHRMVCRCTAGASGFLEALFHRAFCKERLPLLRKGK